MTFRIVTTECYHFQQQILLSVLLHVKVKFVSLKIDINKMINIIGRCPLIIFNRFNHVCQEKKAGSTLRTDLINYRKITIFQFFKQKCKFPLCDNFKLFFSQIKNLPLYWRLNWIKLFIIKLFENILLVEGLKNEHPLSFCSKICFHMFRTKTNLPYVV